MKKLLLITSLLLFISCSSKKRRHEIVDKVCSECTIVLASDKNLNTGMSAETHYYVATDTINNITYYISIANKTLKNVMAVQNKCP